MKDVLTQFGEVVLDVDLKKYNTYRIGGITQYLVKPFDVDSLIALIKFLKNNNMAYYLLGSGSNVILPDTNFEGVIIRLDNLKHIEFKNDTCIVEGGMFLASLVNLCLEKGYTNLAFAASIPGTVASAIVGNVGAYNHEIFDYVKDVTILDENDTIKTLNGEDIYHAYRDTEFKKRKVIIIKVTLKLAKGDVSLAKKTIKDNLAHRRETQPLEYPNAGSVFRNPYPLIAGKLIEESHLKGKMIGGAMVSRKHANFIINYNNATSSDIITLIELIKKEIKERNNIDLELEQIIVKW